MVGTYIDVDLSYPDAKVTALLAIGGLVEYDLRKGCRLLNQWILDNTVAQIGKLNMIKYYF